MIKLGIHKSWCSVACCFATVLALSGCSDGAQGNVSSDGLSGGNVIANNQQTAEQETGNQQSAMEQETGNSQSVGSETGNQESAGQELGGQQSSLGNSELGNHDLEYHQYDESGVHHIDEEAIGGHHQSGNMTSQASNAQEYNSSNASSGNNQIDLETAKSIALQSAGVDAANAAFVKTELDYDDGVAEYEIEFVAGSTKYEYDISVANGTVLKSSQEAVEQISGGVSTQPSISAEEAKSIALNYAQFTADHVVYTKAELDYDDGRAEYEIEFYADGKEYSFTIDAVSGAVLEMEIE